MFQVWWVVAAVVLACGIQGYFLYRSGRLKDRVESSLTSACVMRFSGERWDVEDMQLQSMEFPGGGPRP